LAIVAYKVPSESNIVINKPVAFVKTPNNNSGKYHFFSQYDQYKVGCGIKSMYFIQVVKNQHFGINGLLFTIIVITNN
jgi:hypothetical protein